MNVQIYPPPPTKYYGYMCIHGIINIYRQCHDIAKKSTNTS